MPLFYHKNKKKFYFPLCFSYAVVNIYLSMKQKYPAVCQRGIFFKIFATAREKNLLNKIEILRSFYKVKRHF